MITFSSEVTSACAMVSGRLPATSEHCSLPHGNICPNTPDIRCAELESGEWVLELGAGYPVGTGQGLDVPKTSSLGGRCFPL